MNAPLSDATACNVLNNARLAEEAANRSPQNSPIQLRRAEPTDREHLFQWRNHPDVRKHSLNADEIPWDDHCRWFEKTLASQERILLIGLTAHGADNSAETPVGVLRYDLSTRKHDDAASQQAGESADGAALVSIYLVPEQMGKGYGARLLQAGTDWIRLHAEQRVQSGLPAVSRLLAEIRPDNAASVRAFEKAGFLPTTLRHCEEVQRTDEAIFSASQVRKIASSPSAPRNDESASETERVLLYEHTL